MNFDLLPCLAEGFGILLHEGFVLPDSDSKRNMPHATCSDWKHCRNSKKSLARANALQFRTCDLLNHLMYPSCRTIGRYPIRLSKVVKIPVDEVGSYARTNNHPARLCCYFFVSQGRTAVEPPRCHWHGSQSVEVHIGLGFLG